MKPIRVLLFLVVMASTATNALGQGEEASAPFALVIHGGAGNVSPETVPQHRRQSYQEALEVALETGYQILEQGGSAMDATEAAIRQLEDHPNFNAGRGAVLNAEGQVEMDASFMDGRTMNAGAVTGVKRTQHPVSAARAVLEHSPHVLLMGTGAELFAEEQQLQLQPNEYFITPARKARWEQLRDTTRQELDFADTTDADKHGTVGAVALDRNGNLAAATSTGGMTNKWYGRIGDSPIIGAGTYAENGVVGVSCTGHGEYFMRYVVAYDLAARMKYGNATLPHAARQLVLEQLNEVGGSGGLIAIDARGRVVMVYNSPGMFRAYRHSAGSMAVRMYGPPHDADAQPLEVFPAE